jgi:hypothetical protein
LKRSRAKTSDARTPISNATENDRAMRPPDIPTIASPQAVAIPMRGGPMDDAQPIEPSNHWR